MMNKQVRRAQLESKWYPPGTPISKLPAWVVTGRTAVKTKNPWPRMEDLGGPSVTFSLLVSPKTWGDGVTIGGTQGIWCLQERQDPEFNEYGEVAP